MPNILKYTHFKSSHLEFLTSLSTTTEPSTFTEAMWHQEWRDAMQAEIKAFS